MATVTTQQERKDVIAPVTRYYETYEWVLEENTQRMVGVRVTRTPVTN